MSYQLTVAGVIHRLHPNNLVHQLMVMCMDMLDQLELGVPRADDQNFRGALHRLHNVMIIAGLRADDYRLLSLVYVANGAVD